MTDPKNALSELTALDWGGVVMVGFGSLFCFQFPFLLAPTFARMFADLGSAELPALTQLGLTTWFPLMLGLNPASVVFYALNGRRTLGRRRLLIVLSIGMSLLATALCLVAMYLPIFSLAGQIQ